MGLCCLQEQTGSGTGLLCPDKVVPRRVANYTPGLFGVSKDLCDHLARQRDDNGWMNDIFDAMGKWSLKGVSYVVFDEQIDVFSGEDARAAFVKASQEFVEALGLASGILLFYRNIPTWTRDILTRAQNIHTGSHEASL